MDEKLFDRPSWDETHLRSVYNLARMSRDPRTKVAAIIVDRNNLPISHGYNGFARGFTDTDVRWARPQKYEYVVHDAVNAILNAARPCDDAIMYSQGLPCANCAKTICNSPFVKIREIVLHKQWRSYEVTSSSRTETWGEKFKYASEMFHELGIKIRYYDGVLGVQGFLDGEIINV